MPFNKMIVVVIDSLCYRLYESEMQSANLFAPHKGVVDSTAEKIGAMSCLYIISEAAPLTRRGARGV